MRKILSLMTIAILFIFASCEKLNEKPVFDDSNAFVEFNSGTLTVKESKATLSIPVTLASVKGMSASVTYTVTDGTGTKGAKQGVNFTLADPTKTLTFDAENRTQNIVINIINRAGIYDGDLKFTVTLTPEGSLKASAENVCTVTISDLDHPLAKFLGNWSVTAKSYYFGVQTWTIAIDKDPADVTVLWISDIVWGFPKYGYTYPSTDNRFYGTVNTEKTTLSIPCGQTCAYKYQGNDISIVGLDADMNTITSGKIVGTYDSGVITFDLGMYVEDATGYWDALEPVIVWTKL